MTSAYHRPDVVHAERKDVHGVSTEPLPAMSGTAHFRLWWMEWNGFLHGLYLLLGAVWCLTHWTSFSAALPPLAPAWVIQTLAAGLGVLALWLLAETLSGHVRRSTRRWAATISALMAVLCFSALVFADAGGFYAVAGVFHALFAGIWLLLFIARRPRSHRHTRSYP